MTKIKMLCEMIDEELEGAEHYACEAVKFKSSDSGLAATLYAISGQEMEHVSKLHNEVSKLIEAYRKERGDPPVEMLAIYDYLHKKQIRRANEIRNLQGQYKGS